MFLGHDARRVSLNLLATLGGRRDERLVDKAALTEWLVEQGLVDAPYRVGDEDVERMRAFRASLLAVVEAELSGERPSSADVEVINAAAAVAETTLRLKLGPQGLCREEGQPRCQEILGVIARDGIALLTGPQRDLLSECAARQCRGIYLDTSPGRNRRWCSPARCGNRARVAAHRARRADTAGKDRP